MPVQFGNSKIRQFFHNAKPEATLFSPNIRVPTAERGPEKGNVAHNFTLPPGNSRRNNAWSRRLSNSMTQAKRNIRAGINARSMPRSANQALMSGIANEANAKNIAREVDSRRLRSMNSFSTARSNNSNVNTNGVAVWSPAAASASIASAIPSSRSLWQQVLAPPVITSNTSLPNLRVRRSATPKRPSVVGLFSGGRKTRRANRKRRNHKK